MSDEYRMALAEKKIDQHDEALHGRGEKSLGLMGRMKIAEDWIKDQKQERRMRVALFVTMALNIAVTLLQFAFK